MAKTAELVPQRNRFFKTLLSRYRQYPYVVTAESNQQFATYYPQDYPYSTEDQYHTVGPGEEGRLDLISYRYYGTALLWWVIAEANEILHPVDEVVSGVVIRVPSATYVYTKVAI